MYWVSEQGGQASWWYPLVPVARLSKGCSALYLSHQMSMRFLKGFYIVLHFWYALFWF